MADSDDEHDRRRARDKFRRERSDYQERREERNRREEWTERSGRRERDYDPQRRRDRYSPLHHDVSPPIKRMRRDWDGHRRLPGCDLSHPFGGGNMMGGPPHGGWEGGMPQDMGMIHNQHAFGSHQGSQRDIDMPITQPPMMTFKQFLGSQDDSIGDQEAVRKYNEYKLEFRRQQINEFFLNHKEEEWFKSKYHPDEVGKKLVEQRASFKKRLDAFMELLEKNSIDGLSIDSDKPDPIIHLLDAAVIKFEGGSDFDLKCLDEPYEEEEKPKEPDTSQAVKTEEKPVEKKEKDQASQEEKEKEKKSPESRRKRTRNYSSDEDDDSSADSESELESTVSTNNAQEANCETSVVLDSDSKEEKGKQMPDEEKPQSDDVLEKKPNSEKSEENEVKIDDEKKNESEIENKENLESVCPKEDACKDQKPRPRPLHKTKSIFLRNLAPTIAKQEIEAMCKRYDGLLRVAISDPQPERRFLRRGWVTFDRTVNIKEICWNLNNIRLRDCELGAIVNRDLSRRVRSVNGITAHKQVVLSDIKLATRMIQNLDEKRNLWDDPGTKQKEQNFGIVSRNPLLRNITDYLIEEASAEEEELLGMSEETKQNEDTASTLERDETLIKVLDRLILYLRIVHSLDYYNHCEYVNEDEMPNRCGIIHARGLPPSVKVTQREINDYIRNFEQKAAIFLQPRVKLNEDEALILGRKDPIAEVEKFVQANTQELAKDKWLCPLSGKKFKGAEFVRKHIFNKHAIKVEEVRKEVKYFNNYLIDPKRPQLSPHPSNCLFGSGPSTSRDEMYPVLPSHHGTNGSYPLTPMPYGGSHRGFQNKDGYGASFGGRSSSSGGFNKRSNYGRRSNPREVIGYHDLDRPQDLEMF